MNEEDQITGTAFDYPDDDPMVIIITARREYMIVAEYRLTVQRLDAVPTATNVKISVEPGVGSFFIGSGIHPTLTVSADLPPQGGELSYQWYKNTENNTRGGYPLSGQTGTSYQMRSGETLEARTLYYYVVITNTIDGQTGITDSPTQPVTFLNKWAMHEKSLAMMDILDGGEVTSDRAWDDMSRDRDDGWTKSNPLNPLPYKTDGYKIGQYLVTWELWKTIRDAANAGDFFISRSGNQGAEHRSGTYNTLKNPRPIGNYLQPVTYSSTLTQNVSYAGGLWVIGGAINVTSLDPEDAYFGFRLAQDKEE